MLLLALAVLAGNATWREGVIPTPAADWRAAGNADVPGSAADIVAMYFEYDACIRRG